MKTKKYLLLISIVFLVYSDLFAWTSSNEGVCYTMDTLCLLSDSISYNQADKRYEVACDIIILENDTLRINPGQYLYFIMLVQPPISWGEYYGIKIFGTLLAIGESDKLINLGDKEYNISNGNVWQGIQFYNTSPTGGSILKHCIIQGAICLNNCGFGSESAIYCENSSPIIDHCKFCYMLSGEETGGGSAIACKEQSYPIISYCTFEYLINSIAIWSDSWGIYPDTINYPSPLVYGCNIMPSVQGFYYLPIWNDVIVFSGGFLDNCYLGINSYSADTTLGTPIDTVGDGICNTTSTNGFKRFMNVDGVKNPRGDTLLTGINEAEIEILPTTSQHLTLKNCYPNPFNNYTTIEFELKKSSKKVSLMVIDSKGNMVRKLIMDKSFVAGEYNVKWNGDNDTGQKVPEGIYFYKLIAGNSMMVKKAIVVK